MRREFWRLVLTGVGIVLTLALQTTVVSRLPLPGGRPDLLLVVVVAAALGGGVNVGVGIGFTVGLAADLLSPHPAGLLALIYLVVGLTVGRIDSERQRGVGWSVIVVVVAGAASLVGYVLLLTLVSRHAPSLPSQLADLPTSLAYDVLLTPFVVPVVTFLERTSRPTMAFRV
ncbi:MAG: rod shape-determining protein MreD [Mycobacteriales bacterium]